VGCTFIDGNLLFLFEMNLGLWLGDPPFIVGMLVVLIEI
jgi:hypothetical protein